MEDPVARAEALTRQIDEIRKLNLRLQLENAELLAERQPHPVPYGQAEHVSAQLSAIEQELSALRQQLGSTRYRVVDRMLGPLERHPSVARSMRKGAGVLRKMGAGRTRPAG